MNIHDRFPAACGVLFTLALAGCPGDDTTSDDGVAGSDSTGVANPTTGDATTGGIEPAGTTTSGAPETSSTGEPGDSSGSDGSGSGDSTGGDALEIAGEWFELFGDSMQTHSITETTWTQASDFGTSAYHVEGWDDAMGVLVALGDATNEFNPDLYSRFEWTWDGAELYYCQSVFDAATADDAWNATGADAGDLATGCAGFPWSHLMPVR